MTAVSALRDGAWTLERLTDELFFNLCFYDHYYRQAEKLMYLIPVCEPAPPFVIKVKDLGIRIVKELEGCTMEGRNYALHKAVGRVFEGVDYRYFHLSVKSRLVVKLEEE